MPAVRSLDVYQDKKRAVAAWIMGGIAIKNLNKKELAAKTGMPESTLGYRIRNPGTLTTEEKWRIQKVIGTPKDLAKELIELVGGEI